MHRFLLLAVLAAACNAATGGNPTSATVTAPPPSAAGLHFVINVSAGGYLVDEAGKTLYTFDNDTGSTSTSTCYDQCAQTWPSVISPNNALPMGDSPTLNGTLATFQRTDGSGYQVSYNGDPLYYYSGDSGPGDTKGDGVGGVWHLAGITSTASPSAVPASPAPSSASPGGGGGGCDPETNRYCY